jgi:TPP-dependent pyruvate/acetoin dehydrogenase alpha subunit
MKTYAEFLMTEGIASSEDLESLRKEVDAEINEATDIAWHRRNLRPNRHCETFIRQMLIRHRKISTPKTARSFPATLERW